MVFVIPLLNRNDPKSPFSSLLLSCPFSQFCFMLSLKIECCSMWPHILFSLYYNMVLVLVAGTNYFANRSAVIPE